MEMKSVKGYEGLYSVTDDGRVYSHRKNRFLSGYMSKNGYAAVHLANDGQNIAKYIHRLVAESFLENPDNKDFVDHIDTDKLNNHVTNLRWATRLENNRNPITRAKMSASQMGHKRNLGRFHSEETKRKIAEKFKGRSVPEEIRKKGNICSKQKCSIRILQLSKDGALIRRWPSIAEASVGLGISRGNICACLKGYYGCHTAGGYVWQYDNV